MVEWYNLLESIDKSKKDLRDLAIDNSLTDVVSILDKAPKTLWYNPHIVNNSIVKALKKYQETNGNDETAYGVSVLKVNNSYNFLLKTTLFCCEKAAKPISDSKKTETFFIIKDY